MEDRSSEATGGYFSVTKTRNAETPETQEMIQSIKYNLQRINMRDVFL